MRKWLHDTFNWHQWEKVTYRREVRTMSRYMKGRRCRICKVTQSRFFGKRYWITVPDWQITHQT